jgi:hypothetical protein
MERGLEILGEKKKERRGYSHSLSLTMVSSLE